MKQILLGTCVACVVAMSPALAADMPTKAPPPPPPAPSWTGFYAGINAGGSIGVNSDAQNAAVAAPLVGANGLLSTADKHASPGALAGGQIGFNWQLPSRWLVGVEADWQWTSQKNLSAACTPAAALGFFGAGASGFGYCLGDESKITNFGTARARGGVLVQDTLWYATGGLAWGTVRDDFAFAGSAQETVFPPALQPGPFLPSGATFSKTRLGWTLGAGAETKIAAGWSAKMEYLYVDLGTVNESIAIPINPPFAPAFAGGSAAATRSTHITDHVVRVGLNYHFSPFGIDAPAAPGLPLKAPPAPPALGWSGFHAGVNAGGSIGVNSDAQNATFAAPALGTSGLLSTGDKHASPGALAGGQIGYNWQLSPRWLVGLEADWQWTSQKNASAACTPPAATTGFFNVGGSGFGYCLSEQSRITNLGTERVRGGALVGNSLWYATGGVAWGTVRDDVAFAGSANTTVFPGPLAGGPFLPGGATFSKNKLGWTLGAGVETKLDSRWSAKIEYLYVDLGTVSEAVAIPINPAFGPAFTAGSATATRNAHITDNIVRAGVNYTFF
jgi:outer membrane immunogenic protein